MSPSPSRAAARGPLVSAAVGAAVWAASLLVVRPSLLTPDWPLALLWLAALVAVPLVLRLVAPPRRGGVEGGLWRVAAVLQPPAALLLLAAAAVDGTGSLLLALPWLAVTGLLALLGAARLLRRRRWAVDALCVDAGLIFVAVGGAWTTAHHAGMRPMGFSPIIVLLTAVHFHYAGLLLPVLTGLAARRVPGWMATAASLGVIAGVPLTAVGITATQMGVAPGVEATSVAVTVAGAALAALLHLRLAVRSGDPWTVRVLWGAAGVSLLAGMGLAGAYGVRAWVPVAWLGIPWMQALHGSVNALGFGMVGTLAWTLATRDDAPPATPSASG